MNFTQSMLNQFFEHCPHGLQLVDSSGRTLRVNEPFLRMFDVPDRASVEGTYNLLEDPRIGASTFLASLQRALEGRVMRVPPSQFPIQADTPCLIRTTMIPLTGDSADDRAVVLLYEDVTETISAEFVLERRYEQISALQRTFRDIGDAPQRDRLVASVMDAMVRLCGPDACALWLVTPGNRWRHLASHGLSDEYREGIESVRDENPEDFLRVMKDIAGSRASQIEDTREAPLDDHRRRVLEREGIRRVLTVPMRREGRVEGTLSFYGKEPGPFDPVDVDVAILLSDQLTLSLHNIALLDEAQETADEARTLYEISRTFAQALSVPDVIQALDEVVAPRLRVGRITICAHDPNSGELSLLASTAEGRAGMETPNVESLVRIPEVARALDSGETLLMDDPAPLGGGDLSEASRSALEALGFRSVILTPIPETGTVGGLVAFDDPRPLRKWTERDRRIARGVAQQIATALRTAYLIAETRLSRDEMEERVRTRTADLRAAQNEMIASERLAAIGIMAREVAHGLRNPLNVISTSRYYLHSRFTDPDEKVLRHLDTISHAVDQAATMINNLTSLAGPRQPELAPLDLNNLVQRVLQERFTTQGISWDTEWDPNLPYISGDWIQVNHAVKALLNNVIGSASQGTIHIRTGRKGDRGYVMVGGRRATLTEGERAALFEPFSVSSTQWTGLDLSVARQIAIKHGGDVDVLEEEGIILFRLSLPFASRQAP